MSNATSKLRPLGNRVVVQPLSEEEKTGSGIILPDSVDKEKKAEGKIIAIGSGDKIVKLGLKTGDRVIFGKYAGEEVKVDTIEYKILTDEDVLAVVES
ncbi:MAG: co-chaperone GroES [bacterium]|nr:co-chaperone GroES [bacterium]